MNKTKIDWCDMSWNPVTGCRHGCPYCYAEHQANRFETRKGHRLCTGDGAFSPICFPKIENGICKMESPLYFTKDCGATKTAKAPFPYGFTPTFHKYRLNEPGQEKKSQNIFVVSMGDLFGAWVPDEWIQEVFEACEQASQHRYIFLTKNPSRYGELYEKKMIPHKDNYWFGTSITKAADPYWFFKDTPYHSFVSIEPILENFEISAVPELIMPEWVIVGAETGNRKGKIIPQRSWIEDIVKQCRTSGTSIFMKSSLSSIWGEPLIQEFPWGQIDD